MIKEMILQHGLAALARSDRKSGATEAKAKAKAGLTRQTAAISGGSDAQSTDALAVLGDVELARLGLSRGVLALRTGSAVDAG